MTPTTPDQLTSEDLALLPTEADLAFYRAHGYWIAKRLFSAAEIEHALAGMERYYLGERDAELAPGVAAVNWQPGKPGLRKSDYACLQNRELMSVVQKPVLAAIAACLAGCDEIRLWHDQLLYKPPSHGDEPSSIGWHTDRGYWVTCSSEEMVTAWVAFDDVDESMGPMLMVDGSNRWTDHHDLNFFEQNLDEVETHFQSGGAPIVKVPMLLERGQVSFHHVRTIHGSGKNRSTRPRRALTIHMQPGDNRFQKFTRSDGSIAWHVNDFLVRQVGGAPDYSDPSICPTLFSGRVRARAA